MTSNHLFTGVRVDSCLLQDLVELKSKMNILRATGIASLGGRMAFMAVDRRDLDRDRLHETNKRVPDSGIDRVRLIFDRREDGSISPELNSMNLAGFTGMFIGGIIGGAFQARTSNINFRESNEATLFKSKLDAARQLQNESTVGFGKGAFRMGWRTGIFCWTFIGVSTIVSEFRNKSSISDYSIAGLVTGALFKFNLGIKGMISGGFFGTLIGTVGGIAFISLIKLSGKTMKEIREAQGRYIYARDEAMHATAKKQLKEPDIILSFYPESPATKDNSVDFLNALDDGTETPPTNELVKNTQTPPNVQPTSNK